MPLARRSGQRSDVNIWPGFVDALTALLLILTFVLSIFMIVQYNMRETITGQTRKLDNLNAQLLALSDALALERGRAADLEAELGAMRATLSARRAELETLRIRLSEEEEARLAEAAAAEALRERLKEGEAAFDVIALELEESRRRAEETLTLLAAAEAARDRLDKRLAVQADAFDREAALRRIAEAELAQADRQTAEQARRSALLSEQIKQLNSQLAALRDLLDESEKREAEGRVRISNLGARLNAALARKAALEAENAKLLAERIDRLEQVRSVFLERVEGAMAGREGIRRVGDRFVFQSEVLFDAGSADLGAAGRRELTRLGEVMREIAGDMPEDLDWILRVDGHTDKRPLSGAGRYRNNWELSQARALSVVAYLIDAEGANPSRLAAAGFGEFQPIDPGDDSEALARNRRIEFKFTER